MKDEYDFKDAKPSRHFDKTATKTMVSIRLDNRDLCLLRDEADRLGIPYQTLINSLIHRFVFGELIDKNEARKIAI